METMAQIKSRELTWEEGRAKTITFIVTEDCQLRCKYCYLVGKSSGHRMDFAVAKQTVDYLLREREIFNAPSVIWEFIGGEPFMEVDLIDTICDYIKFRSYELNHPWFNSYRFSFSTNGLQYHEPKVQQYIDKNRTHLSIGITIDGTKTKHDLQRVYSDGRGSYDDVIRNIPMWVKQFPHASTKVTVASDDLPYIVESVLHIWQLGVKTIHINVVFEDVWQNGDDEIFEDQLRQLADIIIRDSLYREYQCSFFADYIGKPLDPAGDNQNWCGTGMMLAVDGRGDFYPCVRFAPHSLSRREPRMVGNCFDGINLNKLRPFFALNRVMQSPSECLSCEVASGCAWCQGANYDFADTDTIYQRATYICKMHKARVRANRYYWDRLHKQQGEKL